MSFLKNEPISCVCKDLLTPCWLKPHLRTVCFLDWVKIIPVIIHNRDDFHSFLKCGFDQCGVSKSLQTCASSWGLRNVLWAGTDINIHFLLRAVSLHLYLYLHLWRFVFFIFIFDIVVISTNIFIFIFDVILIIPLWQQADGGGCCHQTTSSPLAQVRFRLSPAARAIFLPGRPHVEMSIQMFLPTFFSEWHNLYCNHGVVRTNRND